MPQAAYIALHAHSRCQIPLRRSIRQHVSNVPRYCIVSQSSGLCRRRGLPVSPDRFDTMSFHTDARDGASIRCRLYILKVPSPPSRVVENCTHTHTHTLRDQFKNACQLSNPLPTASYRSDTEPDRAQALRAVRARAVRCAASGEAGNPGGAPSAGPGAAGPTKTAIRKLRKVRRRSRQEVDSIKYLIYHINVANDCRKGGTFRVQVRVRGGEQG